MGDIDDGGDHAYMGAGGIWEFSVPPFSNFLLSLEANSQPEVKV